MKRTSLLTGKALAVFLVIGMLLSACGNDLWGSYDPSPTATIDSTPNLPAQAGTTPLAGGTVASELSPTQTSTPSLTPTPSQMPLTATEQSPSFTSPSSTPTEVVTMGMPGNTVPYISQSGDSLNVVASHFGVQPVQITSPATLPANGFINPGTLLFLPAPLTQVPSSPYDRIIPDSELVDSPSAVGFDIADYVKSAGGKLSTFTDYHSPVGTVNISGAEAVQIISAGSSISPRLILALIQYFTGWVLGQSKPGLDESRLFGYAYLSYNPATPTLYQPMRPAIQDLLTGYYGWRAGKLSTLTFPDGTTLRIAPDLNAGTVALQYFFSRHLDYADWLKVIDPNTGFLVLYKSMFGDPWERANELGPLFPANLNQPNFSLPFDVGAPWNFTNGPHPAWEAESALGALDFAPSGVSGCDVSSAWVVAIAPGQIVRSESSYVVLDLDGDGFEQTGWVVIYQHIGAKDRIPACTWVNAGAHIGHPSCEGGEATGTNLHIARKYNGEWVAAGGPLPFILSGWTTHAGNKPGDGTLTRDDKVITASPVSEGFSKIIRQPGE